MGPYRDIRGGPRDLAPGGVAPRRPMTQAAAALLAVLLWSGAALAQTTPRAADHQTFGRMVFDWHEPVRFTADVANDHLVLHFGRPVAGDPHDLLKPLSRYVRSVTISPDRRTLTFPLAAPIEVKTFTSGDSSVIDLTESHAAKAPPPHGEPPREAATDVSVRGGDHSGYTRVVFDWHKPVPYSVTEESGRLTIAFGRPARVNTTALAASLPPGVTVAEIRPEGRGTAVVLAVPAGMRARHFANGPKVVLDLIRAPGAPPPAAAPAPAPQPAGSAPADLPAAAPPAAASASAAAPPAPAAEAEAPQGPMVGISFDQPAAAAAFPRAGWLWLVFDRPTDVDPKALIRTGRGIVLDAQAVPARGGSALRLLLKPGYQPVPRRDGTMWLFDLEARPLAPESALAVSKQFDFEDKGRLLITGGQPVRTQVLIRDPEVGDIIAVMPTRQAGAGVATPYRLPALDLLATAQGVAIVPHADGAHLEAADGAVSATMPGGIVMSRSRPAAPPAVAPQAGRSSAGRAPAGAAPLALASTAPLDIGRWTEGGLDHFETVYQRLLGALAAAPLADRWPLRLALARHDIANGMDAEAIGILRTAVMASPSLEDNPDLRAVRGAAEVLLQRNDAAIADLSLPALANDRQVALWLAAARTAAGDQPTQQAAVLRALPDEMKTWTPRLRLDIARIAVPALAAAGDAQAAARVVGTLTGPGFGFRDQGTIDYLSGLADEAGHNDQLAIQKYRAAEAGWSRPDRAFAARNRIELQLRLGQITNAEAIHQLEHLRFAWRGGDFEYQLLKRLGMLLLADGQYGEGLRTLRSLIDNFPDNPDIANVAKNMQAAFNHLFLDGAADKLQPVVAIGLYDEFQELTPQGDQGDEMIRKLADRLAAVDLTDRAAELLRHQVQFRLSGVEKAKVGARLAFIELADHKAQAALDALNMSEIPDQPPELYNQRRYLRVRALADLGRSAEALALIINDDSPPARALRAQIYWDMKKWSEAAAALQALLPPPSPGHKPDPVTARRVLDLATALTLAKDERGLQHLRHDWSVDMAATDLNNAFDLLTAPPDEGIPDYRSMPEKIKEAEDFQSFMADWNKRVKAKGLSSLN